MIPTIVAAISFVTLIVTTTVIAAKGADMKKQYDDRLRVMADQINNAQYYNSEIDKKNITDISDVRKTYTSKDELSRSVDTRDLSARRATANDLEAGSVTGEYMHFKKSSSDNLRTNKLLASGGVVSQLDASVINSSRVNLVGAASFGSAEDGASRGEYLVKRGSKQYANDLVVQVPKGASFDVSDQDGNPGITMKPTEGEVRFSSWSVGKAKDADAEKQGVKYDMLGVSFDNKVIAGFYQMDGKPTTQLTDNVKIKGDEAVLTILGQSGDPMVLSSRKSGNSITGSGKAPLEVWGEGGVRSGGLMINKDTTSVNNVVFASDPSKPANITNDSAKLALYGTPNGKDPRNIALNDNVYVSGNAVSKDWASATNTHGRDHVVAGNWSAWMRNDGLVQGKNVNSDQWASGQNIMGRDHVVAGNWAAWMRNDGMVQGNYVNSGGWSTGQNVQGRDHVLAGNSAAWMRKDGAVQGANINSTGWSTGQNLQGRDQVVAGNSAAWMRKDGQTFAKNSIVSDRLTVGNVQITGADGAITARKITTGQLNPQGGLLVGDGPLQLTAAATFGAASASGPNKRFVLTKDGKVGINTDAPNAALHVNGDAIANSIGRQGGNTDWFKINPQNGNVAANPGIAAYNGLAINDGGGLSVGSWTKAPPGVIQTTSKVIAPALTRRAGDNNWLLINSDNPAAPMAVYGGASVAKGLSVGAFDASVATGNVRATGKIIAQGITRKAGEAGSLDVNSDNQAAMMNVYGPASLAKGLYVGAANNTSVLPGSIQASGNVAASSFTRKASTNDWLRIDNASGPGVALVGSGAVTKGLSVGVADAAVPLGNVKATNGLCINSTCLTETDLRNIKNIGRAS